MCPIIAWSLALLLTLTRDHRPIPDESIQQPATLRATACR